MTTLSKYKHFAIAIGSIFACLLFWTLLFKNNNYINPVLSDIHLIYFSTLAFYLLIKISVSTIYLDFIKIFVRTLFRVWLLIFITLSIVKSMDRVGLLLSITFLFGYFEGCLDLDRWLQSNKHSLLRRVFNLTYNKWNEGFLVIFFMSIIHILCSFVIFLFSFFTL